VTFSAHSDGICLNTADVQYTPAASPWGTITYLALFDAATGGNMLWYGVATLPVVITISDIYRVTTGALAVGLA
jgi:hypothetical protein